MKARQSLYQSIGQNTVTAVVEEFYRRAFDDGIIGHFFFQKDRQHITAMQIDFATALLDGPKQYRGKALEAVHLGLQIREAHFRRRQMLLRQVMDEAGIPSELAEAWLKSEEALKPLIMKAAK